MTAISQAVSPEARESSKTLRSRRLPVPSPLRGVVNRANLAVPGRVRQAPGPQFRQPTASIPMRLLLALLLPWLQFFTIGRPFAGIICLILQLTIIGWLPAAIWSVYALSQYKTDQKIEKALATRR